MTISFTENTLSVHSINKLIRIRTDTGKIKIPFNTDVKEFYWKTKIRRVRRLLPRRFECLKVAYGGKHNLFEQ